MFKFHLVQQKVKDFEYSFRVNSISEVSKRYDKYTFPITKNKDARDYKTFKIGITKYTWYKVNASLSYTIIPPEYSDTAQMYTEFAQDAQKEIDKIKSNFTNVTWSLESVNTNIETLSDEDKEKIGDAYFIGENSDSKLFLGSLITESPNIYLEAVKHVSKTELDSYAKERIKYLEDVKSKHEATVNAWRELGEESRRKFGYLVLFEIKVGNLGCDVKYLRLNSSRGVVVSIESKRVITSNKLPVYNYHRGYLTADNVLDIERDFSEQSFNKHNMYGQTYYAIEIVTEPTSYYWLEVSAGDGKWLKGDGKLLEFNGLTLVTVTDINDDTGIIKAVDDAGNEYTAQLTDFSDISVGSRVHLAKKFTKLTKTSDGKKVKIENGEGTQADDFTTVIFEVEE